MKILFIGDIVGRPGRNAVKTLLPKLKAEYNINIVLANGENMAAGLGMTFDKYNEMRELGIEYFTGGNHIFDKKEFLPYLDNADVRVLRPANYPESQPGRGVGYIESQGKKIQLINLVGHAFMRGDITNVFDTVDEILNTTEADIRIVDFHAEATSEKAILGYYLDGKVTAFFGTHTHVPTADERILPKGTAFQTDLGMTGPLHSSLGAKIEPYYQLMRFNERTDSPLYKVASGPVFFNATLLEIDDASNHVISIKRIQHVVEQN